MEALRLFKAELLKDVEQKCRSFERQLTNSTAQEAGSKNADVYANETLTKIDDRSNSSDQCVARVDRPSSQSGLLTPRSFESRGQSSDVRGAAKVHARVDSVRNDRETLLPRVGPESRPDDQSVVQASSIGADHGQGAGAGETFDLERRFAELRTKFEVLKAAHAQTCEGYYAERRKRKEAEIELERLRKHDIANKSLIKQLRAASKEWREQRARGFGTAQDEQLTRPDSPAIAFAQQPAQVLPSTSPPKNGDQSESLPKLPELQTSVDSRPPLIIRSSQTTQDEECSNPHTKDQIREVPDSDDEPVVVSTRNLKRKRSTRAPIKPDPDRCSHVESDVGSGTTQNPLPIKSEDSDVLPLAGKPMTNVQDSNLDLDADIDLLTTPRKKRLERMEQMRRSLEVPLSSARSQRASSDPLDLVGGLSTRPQATAKLRPVEVDVLQPLPVNRTIDNPAVSAKRHKVSHNISTPLTTHKPSSTRLQSLLQHDPHRKTPLASPHLPTLEVPKQTLKKPQPLPPLVKQETPKAHYTPTTHPPSPPSPSTEPLRARPASRLRLTDFKLNPRRNQGLSFAFAEPARTKEAKRCLPGCTDDACCGGVFRALASVAGAELTRSTRLWASSQEDADERLLGEYLGDDAARIESMGVEEREEMLLRARAAKIAQGYGVHRTAHARRATPAGFWDADWPSMSQAERNRVQTAEGVRSEVVERRAEALRGNGRWLFRDE